MTQIPFFFPLFAILCLLIPRNKPILLGLQTLLSISYMILSFYNLFTVHHDITIQMGMWQSFAAINIHIDKITLLFTAIFSAMYFLIMLFCLDDLQKMSSCKEAILASWFLLLAALGCVATYDIFNLYVWTELLLVSAFVLIILSDHQNLHHVFAYATLNIVGTLMILLSIALFYGYYGSLHYGIVAGRPITATAVMIIVLLIGSFAVKAGVFPLYFWLGKVYPKSNNFALLLLSAFSTKSALVVLLRWSQQWDLIHNSMIASIFIVLGCITMVLGVFAATAKYNIREILSYHIISQVGYIVVSAFVNSDFAIVATVYFIIHNIFVKNNLMMVSASIKELYQDEGLAHLGCILKKQKFLACIFLLSAFSLAGFPPLSGFWAKFLLLYSLLASQHYIASSCAIIVSLFTLYSMVKIWRFAFCEAASEKQRTIANSKRISLNKRISLALTCACHLSMALLPMLIFNYLAKG